MTQTVAIGDPFLQAIGVRLPELRLLTDPLDRESRSMSEQQRLHFLVPRRVNNAERIATGIHDRIDGLQRSIVYLAVGLTGGMLAGFGGMATLIATQI